MENRHNAVVKSMNPTGSGNEFATFTPSTVARTTIHRVGVWLGCILILGVLGCADFFTGFEISFFVFYFIPVAYAASRLGMLAGLLIAVLSAVVWAVVDTGSGHVYSQPIFAVWSALVRLTAFLAIAWLTARNAELLARERLGADKLRQTLAEVKLLEGLLPICAHCKRIRGDRGEWERLESYIQDRTEARFTHGVCPECAKEWLREAGLDHGRPVP